MSWVTKQRCCDVRGYTQGMIKARIQRGHWRQGVEWTYDPNGLQILNLDAIDALNDSCADAQRNESTSVKRAPRKVVGSLV